MTNGHHRELEGLIRRQNRLAVADRHRLRERAGHLARNARPVARTEPDGMNLDLDVGRVDEHRLQVLDVFLNALGLVSVGPGNDDVVRMALRQPVPLLVAEDIEVEHVEDLQVLLDGAYSGRSWRHIWSERPDFVGARPAKPQAKAPSPPTIEEDCSIVVAIFSKSCR